MRIQFQVAQFSLALVAFIVSLAIPSFSPVNVVWDIPLFNTVSFLFTKSNILSATIFFLCFSAIQLSFKRHYHYFSEYATIVLLIIAAFSSDLFSFFILVEMAFLFLSYGRRTPNLIRGINAVTCGMFVSLLIFCIFFVFRSTGQTLLTAQALSVPQLKISLMVVPIIYLWIKSSVFPFNFLNHVYTDRIDARAIGLVMLVTVTVFYFWIAKFLSVIIDMSILNNSMLWILVAILSFHVVIFVGRSDFNNMLITYSSIMLVLMAISFCLTLMVSQNVNFVSLSYFAAVIAISIIAINAKMFDEIHCTTSLNFIKNNLISSVFKNSVCLSCIALFAIPGSLIFVFWFNVIFNAFTFNFAIGMVLSIVLLFVLLTLLSFFYRFLLAKTIAEKRGEYVQFVAVMVMMIIYFIIGFFPQLVAL